MKKTMLLLAIFSFAFAQEVKKEQEQAPADRSLQLREQIRREAKSPSDYSNQSEEPSQPFFDRGYLFCGKEQKRTKSSSTWRSLGYIIGTKATDTDTEP
jgi:hypothetical protein